MTIMKCLAGIVMVIFLASCSTVFDQTSREVEKETREKRKLNVLLSAKGGGYTINLRENNFFDYHGRAETETSSFLFAGTYERKGDSLLLAFHNNYKPEDLTGLGKIDEGRKTLVLLSREFGRDRQMVIQ
jgi:hypothetical protein